MRLIDADELIKEVNENKELFEKERVYLEGLLLNAPTVPLPDFKEGYKQAIIDGETNFSRQQGDAKNMICPYRKMTETVDGTTKEYFMDCYGAKCPYYMQEQNFSDGLYVPAFCKRPDNER